MAADLVVITDRGEFLQFSDADPRITVRRDVQGSGLPLVGIDVRPADGRLYGLDRGGGIHVIDSGTAVATFRARLSVDLAPAAHYVVDFDPVDDRLRIVGAGGQNLSADVETGAAVVHAAAPPGITAGAHATPGAGEAQPRFFVFDRARDTYGRLDPVADGVLRPVVQAPGIAPDAADIGQDGGRPKGWSVINNILHFFDVETGAASAVQAIGTGATGRAGRIIDIAVLP
ncbi:lipoprotein [Allostella humosa]|nr:lipoprotein [Stella humosa]